MTPAPPGMQADDDPEADDTGPLDIVFEAEEWQALPLATLAAAALTETFAFLDLQAEGYEIVLLACDDTRIADLNAEFRDRPQPTNVLSWPCFDLAATDDGDLPMPPPDPDPDDPVALGDVALAWQTCQREAAEQGKTLADHVQHLVIHSLLHLLGYDHIRDKDAALMEETETKILARLGVADPYGSGV